MLFCPHDGNLLLVENVRARRPPTTSAPARAPALTLPPRCVRQAGPSTYSASSSSASSSSSSSYSAAGGGGGVRFYCQTCPYVQRITGRIEKRLPLARKKVDDVLGGEDAWKNVDQTEAKCPSCPNTTAYFIQIQIRSADEPMTIFYKCTSCSRTWSSN